ARRHAEGLVAQSLAWGMWTSASGMTSERLSRRGFGELTPTQSIALFEEALKRPESQLVPIPIDLKVKRKQLGNDVPPLWRALIKVSQRTAKAKGDLARELRVLDRTRRLERVLEVVRIEVARALALPGPNAVSANRPLKELGLDSVM